MSIEDLYSKVQELQTVWKQRLTASTPETFQELQTERNDSFRTTLEPLVYDILRNRFHEKLTHIWTSYTPPKQSKYAFVIVERREHPNFEWILKNIAWAGPYLSVYIFCSDLNEQYIRTILGDKADAYHLRSVFKGNPSRERGKKEVDNLLSNWQIYASIESVYSLTVEMDCFFRKKIPKEIFTGDYWGCTWGWQTEQPGGGGLTIRKNSSMVELCRKYKPDLEQDLHCSQDCWLALRTMDEDLDFPRLEFRVQYLMENILRPDAVGVHQFWTYLFTTPLDNKEQWCAFVSHILTLETI